MIQTVDIHETRTLDDYAEHLSLKHAVGTLRADARTLARALEGRTVWMINSAAEGGGVAEMLPKIVGLLREIGVRTEWLVIHPREQRFFDLTKRLHNLLHGASASALSSKDRALYEAVSRRLADALRERISPEDILAVHDPQPLGMGALLKERVGARAVWRCHIGFDQQTPGTRAAWDFLRPWAQKYDRAVFSVRDYVPAFLEDGASIIAPGIDPLSHKNRDLSVHKLAGILCNAALTTNHQPVLTSPFDTPAMRLQPDGSFGPASQPDDLGLLFRPIVTQVSRWDRLKGFAPLLRGFVRLKKERHARQKKLSARHRRRLGLVRLVLAGPDPASVQDDPEGRTTFEEICGLWKDLPPDVQQDVAVLMLPMDSRKDNALMVNALQRCATVVAQNSLREGFGLTATEAMWKGCPVLGTHAVGLRQQIRDGEEGRLVREAQDPEEVAATLDAMLEDAVMREAWGRNGQRRVADCYLVFSQVHRWLTVLHAVAGRGR